MKNIILKNPEQAQQIFKNHGWTDKDEYFFQVESDITEVMLNGEVYSPSLLGNSLNIGFGSAYTILLEEFDNEVILELKEIDGLGALLIINQIPYCLLVFRTSNETKLKQIGDHYPELRIIDFGSDENEGVKNLDGIVACRNLKELILNNCKNLNDISGLQSLNHLETLCLDGFTDSSQFHYISCCKHLHKIYQSGSQLTSIKHASGLYLLELLDISSNSGLTDLSPLSGLSALTNLNLGMCENLTDLSPLSGLSALRDLDLSGCSELTDFSPLSGLSALTNLNLSECKNLTDLSPLSGLNALNNLDLSSCRELTDLSPLSGLNALKFLVLIYCRNLTDLSPLSGFGSLIYLYLYGCENLTDLSPLSGLNALTYLNLSRCRELTDLSPLSGLNELNNLDLSGCSELTDLSPLSGLSALTNLDLSRCRELTDLSPLSGLNELNNLDLSGCSELTDFSPLSGLSALTNLNLSECKNLTDLSPLSGLNALNNLDLSRCRELTDLSPLLGLNALNNLDLSGCSELTDLSPLSGLNALNNLDLSGCSELTDLSPLSGLSALTNLNLSECKNLTDLSPLSGLSALTDLDLSECDNLTDLSPLSGLSALTNLKLANSNKITRIKNIIFNKDLVELSLTGCSNIRDFESLASLHFLEKLEWIDPLACSLILMQSAYNRNDQQFIKNSAEKWIAEIELSKDATDYLSKLLRAVSLLKGDNNLQLLTALSTAMRSRGLQSEGVNDLDAFTWETWCNLVLELELPDAVNCLKAAVTDLDIQRETEVLLGPIIIAASELIEKYPSEKGHLLVWVNEQLQQLHDYPTEERQVAPSAAVFYASLHMKDEVLFWLAKATDEKAPLWQDKVVVALINYYAGKEEFTECRRLLDQIKIEDQKDLAISSIAVAMAEKYPVEAVFLLDDIKELSISTTAAKRLLQNSSVLSSPQGIYQLLLHLQSNTEELSSTITKMIEKDLEGKVVHAVKQLFLQKQPDGPSAAVLLELCQHPVVGQFVKAWKLEEWMNQLRLETEEDKKVYVGYFIEILLEKKLIDVEEKDIMKQKMLPV